MENSSPKAAKHCSMKKFFALFSLLPLSFFAYFIWFWKIPHISVGHLSNVGNTTVLLWYWPFSKAYGLEGDVCWDRYQIPHCKLVDQRSYFPWADVVVFHNWELAHRQQKLPTGLLRPDGQRWAWMSLESPDNNNNLAPFAKVFNITVSYRRDADVVIPYGELRARDGQPPEEREVNKSALACWVVSNYWKHHKRSKVYKELSAVIPVQVYGSWVEKPLSSSQLLPTLSRCYFYLAFENSVGKDYITEKLWRNSFLSGAVPVVLGAPIKDYLAVAPPHSFIHVDNFTSVQELGKYLKELVQDRKRYEEYFAWRRQWRVVLINDWRERVCKICSCVSNMPKHKVYTDLEAWDKSA